jgi:hypothetical protein
MPYREKAKKKEYNRLYRERNKEYLKNKRKEWELKNRDKLKEYHREYHKDWYQKNKEKRQQELKEYSKSHKEGNKIRASRYVSRHKDKILKYGKIYNKTISGHYRSCRHSAKRRSLLMELSIDQFSKIISRPCFYCGDTQKRRGIDRADNSIGYTLVNSYPCCKICNFMKKSMSVDEFLEHIKMVCEYHNL